MEHEGCEMKDGGPAFPFRMTEGTSFKDSPLGLSKLELFAALAPAKEIEEMTPADRIGCAALLGVPSDKYNGPRDYPAVLARIRFMWAEAMLAESERRRHQSEGVNHD